MEVVVENKKDLTQLSEESLEQKKKFEELYNKQEQERFEQKEQKKINEELFKDPQERMLHIQKNFKEFYENLQNSIKKFDKKTSDIDQLFDEFKNLKEYFVKQNYALTTYDKQQYKEQLEKVETTLYQVRDLVRPRKKFQFSKRNEYTQMKKKVQEVQQEEQKLAQDYTSTIPGFDGIKDQTLRPSRNELKPTWKICNIENSEIHLDGIFDAVYIKNIKNSTIYIGPVKSSVFIDSCVDSKLFLVGHQIRIHNSVNTKFSLFTTSKCVIEHCSKIIFTTYKYDYEQFQEDFKNAGYENKQNLWKEVQDFNWLKQEKSPNYDLEEQ